MIRRCVLVGLILTICLAPLIGASIAHAQSCTINLTYDLGSGPATGDCGMSFGVTQAAVSGPGTQWVIHFDQCVFVKWTSGPVQGGVGGGGFTDFYWHGCDSESDTYYFTGYGNNDPSTVNAHLTEGHWADYMSSTNGTGGGLALTTNYLQILAIHGDSTPPSSLTNLYEPCPELGNDVAIFTNPSLWGPGLSNPTGESKGLVLTNKRASIQVLILPDHKYKIKLIYHESAASDPSQFTVQLADSPFMFVPLDGTTDSQTFLAPEANYVPDSVDHANFALASQLYVTGVPVLGRDLIIDYACLFDTEPNRLGITGEDPNGQSQEACSLVTFQGTSDFIENARRLIAWLWQGLKSLFDCVLRPLLAGIWQDLLNGLSAITRFILQLSTWINAQIPIVWTWLGDSLGNVLRWLGGILGNVLQIVLNGAAVLLNNLGLSGLVNGIIAFIESLPQFFQSAIRIASIVFEIVGFLVTRLFQLILSVIGIIPIIVTAMINGFNNSSAIPFWAPSCSSSNTILSGPCLGFYILDNTVFDGPIFYIFILIDGLVAVNALIWAVERVKKALTV